MVGYTGFFCLGYATRKGEGKLWIQTISSPLKIDLVSYPAYEEGLGKFILVFLSM